MKGYRNTLEDRQITDCLKQKVQITTDEENLFLTVDYMDGKFLIEKRFPNNYLGLVYMQKESEKLNTEEKVINYLGLGEK